MLTLRAAGGSCPARAPTPAPKSRLTPFLRARLLGPGGLAWACLSVSGCAVWYRILIRPRRRKFVMPLRSPPGLIGLVRKAHVREYRAHQLLQLASRPPVSPSAGVMSCSIIVNIASQRRASCLARALLALLRRVRSRVLTGAVLVRCWRLAVLVIVSWLLLRRRPPCARALLSSYSFVGRYSPAVFRSDARGPDTGSGARQLADPRRR